MFALVQPNVLSLLHTNLTPFAYSQRPMLIPERATSWPQGHSGTADMVPLLITNPKP